jgi:hypothetical protein
VNSTGRICKIGGRCSGRESLDMFADIRGNTSLIFYLDKKFWWVGEV